MVGRQSGIPGSLIAAVTLLQKTSLGNRLILRPPPAEQKISNPLDQLIGQQGLAQTLLTPGGMVLINSERYHAESLGMLIESQTPVMVVATRANRIVVRPWIRDDDKTTRQGPLQYLPVVDSEEQDQAATSNNAQISHQTSVPPDENKNSNQLDFVIPDD